MNKNFAALSRYLNAYPEEYKVYTNIVNSYYFPLLLKIAQQQLPLFEGIDSNSIENKSSYDPDFSFTQKMGEFNISIDEANTLDLILDKMKAAQPEKTNDKIIEELIADFIKSPPDRSNYGYGYSGGYRGHAPFSIFSKRNSMVKKYFNLLPELKWEPEFEQLRIPFDNIINIREPGESIYQSKESEDIIRQRLDTLLKNEEAKEILDDTNAKSFNELGPLSQNKLNKILYDQFISEGINYSRKDLESILNAYFETNNEKPEYFKKDIIALKNYLEIKWNKLTSLFNEVSTIKASLDPVDFIEKPESEINNFNDSIYYSSLYAIFIIKKIALMNMDIIPFKDIPFPRRGKSSGDLKYIKYILEKSKLDNDPFIDTRKKIEILDNEIYHFQSSIENFKKYKDLFKKLDKNIINECDKYLSSLKQSDKESLEWIEKYKIDLIRKSYSDSIKSLASNLSSESSKHEYSEEDQIPNYHLYSKIYSGNASQKNLLQIIVGIASSQQYKINSYIRDNIIYKISEKLFNTNKKIFDQTYFEYPLSISINASNKINDTNLLVLEKNKTSYTIDQIKHFIQDWNGTPNLKSFLNVLLSNTKNQELLDRYIEGRVLNNNLYDYFEYNTYFNNFKENIINFINSSNFKTEDELINLSVDFLSEDFFNLMKSVLANNIFNKLKSSTLLSDKFNNNKIDFKSKAVESLAPILSSQTFKKWIPMAFGYEFSLKELENREILDKIINGLISDFMDIYFKDKNIEYKYYDIRQTVLSDIHSLKNKISSDKDRYNIIDYIINAISPLLSEANGQVSFLKRPKINIVIPILDGSTFVFKYKDELQGKEAKVIKRKSYNDIEYELDGKKHSVSYDNIYNAIEVTSPTIENFNNAILSLKEKRIFIDLNDQYNRENKEDNINKIKLLLNEMNYPWNDVYQDNMEIYKFTNIISSFNFKKFNPDNLIDTIKSVVDEIKDVNRIFLFNKISDRVAIVFNGVGFKDISSGIDSIFSRNNLSNLPKREFVGKISELINNSLKDNQNANGQDVHIYAFLELLGQTDIYGGNRFDNIIVPIIKKLNLKDFNTIVQTCYQIKQSTRNFSKQDIDRVLNDGLILDGIPAAVAVEKIINAAAFSHNHSSLSQNYFRTIVNSPNFYSDSKISKEYIESCTILFKYGGIDQFNDSNSNVYKIIDKMVASELITDVNKFIQNINEFSKLCMNKDGIRANLGNSIAEVKLNYLIYKIVNAGNISDLKVNLDMPALIPAWNSLSFEDRAVKFKEYVYSEKEKEKVEQGENTSIMRLYKSISSGDFDTELNIIRRSASSKEQYANDLKVKQIIQKASSSLAMLNMADSLITYSKDAKNKDERLFNFEYNDPSNSFRFRVLRNLDPYHFLVGSDTNCCQRVGGYGHNAAVDSFINPLAGVLLLEVNNDDSWVTASQSYFHYVPKDNGLILDNVEINFNNCSNFFNYKTYDINQIYAAFAEFVKSKNNLTYVRCGTDHNKLDNMRFTKRKLLGGDPRHFEYKKYSDFSASSHIDLLKPYFKRKLNF